MLAQMKVACEKVEPPDWSGTIVAMARDRDVAMFATLFMHFAPLLKGFFLHFGISANAAEDIAQDVMVAVWREAGNYDPERASADTWIFTIARNMRIDMNRNERLSQPSEIVNANTATPPACVKTLARERNAPIHAAPVALSSDQTEVIRLLFFEHWPHDSIAAALGVPRGTVKSRVRLAMERLRGKFDGVRKEKSL